MRHRESAAWSLAMQRQQLLPKSEVLKGEILARSEAAENPAKKMPQERNHAQNLNGNTRTATLSKYLILRIRQVLRRHNVIRHGRHINIWRSRLSMKIRPTSFPS